MNRRVFLKQATLSTAGLTILPGLSQDDEAPAYRQAGPLLMIDLPGEELDPESRTFIRQHRIRAVTLFQRNIVDSEQTRRLVTQLRTEMGPQALIAIDQEGGSVMRTEDLPFAPSAMCLGASNDPLLAFQVGAAVGRGLASLGINWNFAPALDVNSNPENPVIGDRSFGEDPQLVTRLGLAWARGCQSAGVATCVKHFPGHGDTHLDSHLDLPTVEKDRPVLEAVELYPFRQAVANQMPGFMTSHIVYPAFDDDHPATLSPLILHGLLRQAWQYDGVVITDSMKMKAIADRYGRGEAATQALRAGADMVLALGTPREQQATLEAVERAVAGGLVPGDHYVHSLRRLRTLAERFPNRVRPYHAAQRRADEALMRQAWIRGLTPYRAPQPPAPGSKLIVVVAEGVRGQGPNARGAAGLMMADRLARRYDVTPVYYGHRRPLACLDRFASIDRRDATVVFLSTTRQRPDDALKALIQAIRPDLHVALWNPYTVLDVPAPALITYGFRPPALDAVAAWFEGTVEARGIAPIRLG
ncbi:MAG: beta-N-acetylhexosaminidase [Bacteroidetes bacterium]|nr:MAG: beta-N-acetylhexosaminidase [Bacteroidota bacterium]